MAYALIPKATSSLLWMDVAMFSVTATGWHVFWYIFFDLSIVILKHEHCSFVVPLTEEKHNL